MRWEYSEWDQTLQNLLKSFQDLMSLFNYLMLMAGGDVDEVFKWMEISRSADRSIPTSTWRSSASELMEQRIVEQLKEGGYSLTAKGEQVIRQGLPRTRSSMDAEVRLRTAPRAQLGQR